MKLKNLQLQSCFFFLFFFFLYSCLDVIEQALVFGETVVIENLPEKVDPVLEPLLSRKTIKQGRLVLKHEQYTFKHFLACKDH